MRTLYFLLLTLVLHTAAQAVEPKVEPDIWVAANKAMEMAKAYGPRKVLFVTDLDNTLLETVQALGSEPWFNWQSKLLEDATSEKRIACNFDDLLSYYHFAIEFSRTTPVQEDQNSALAAMQEAKIPTIALTARGELIASQTFRELAKNKIELFKTSPAGNGFPAPFVPYDIKKPEMSGLTQKDVETLKLTAARPVVYQRGVFFCDGQNKGAMLKSFIHRIKGDFKGIVFWDNDEKNNKRILQAFEGTGVEVHAYRASRMDAEIKKFEDDPEKTTAVEEFKYLRRLLDRVYKYPRPCQLPIDKTL